MQKIMMSYNDAYSSAIRVMKRCDTLATVSENSDNLTRLYLSSEHLLVNEYVSKWMQRVGMTVWQDAVGNICGRYESLKPNAPALLLGSHLDTVRNAGRFDGILGVLSAIEIVQWLHDHNKRLPLAIEVIGFGDEEGARFGITLLGSRGITGTWLKNWNNYTDSDGISLREAMENVGLNEAKILEASRNINDIVAYLELHIEQGPCLEQENLALGVVTGINGARRLNCCFIGESGHAGTVPMIYRHDALIAASEWIILIEKIILEIDSHLVATVGSLNCSPGTTNVIPGEVVLTLDVRGSNDDLLEHCLSILLNHAKEIALRRQIKFTYEEYYRSTPIVCDLRLQEALNQAVENVQGRSMQLPSGAGHDAIAIAERWPVGMLFLRNYRGISHNPAESVTIEDVAISLQAYLQAIYILSQ